MGSSAFGDATNLSALTVVSYSDNYIPVSDPEITWDEIELKYFATNYKVTSGDDGDCNLYWDLYTHFNVKADNGVVYYAEWKHNINGYRGRGLSGCGGEFSMNYGADLARGKQLIGPDPSGFNDDDWVIRSEFRNEYANILAAINNQIASRQGGLPLPPPNPNDDRKLAVPVLFVHGQGDSAERWGASYARRDCGSPSVLQVEQPTIRIRSFVSMEQRQKMLANATTGAMEPVYATDPETGVRSPVMEVVQVQRCSTIVNVPSVIARCSDGSEMKTGSSRFFGWVQPGTVLGQKSSYPEGTSGEFNALTVSPIVESGPMRVRFVWAHPSGLDATGSSVPEVADIQSKLLLLQQDVSRSYIVAAPSSRSMRAIPGEVVKWGGKLWTLYRADISFEDIGRYANYHQELNAVNYPSTWTPSDGEGVTRVIQSAQKENLVSAYADGSAPDLLARIEHLDRSYKWWSPYTGINDNGIYFFSAWNDVGFKLGSPPAPWSPRQYPEFTSKESKFDEYDTSGGRGQAFQLYERMIEVLDKHYGKDVWKTNPDAKIDVVAHSQGGLLVRDMLAHQNDVSLPDGNPMPQGLAHPGAHIRKFVPLNSPHFGSAFAAKEEDVPTDFSSIKTFKEWMKNEQVLKPETKVDAEAVEDLVTSGFVALGCVGGALAGPAGCILGGLGAGMYALIAGTDVYWSMQGKALGPYNIHLYADVPGPWNYSDDYAIDPAALQPVRERLLDGEPWSYHLSGTSAWIEYMQDAGYPVLPGATVSRTPLWTRPLYTPGLPKLRGDIAEELGRIQSEYCDEHADDWVETCDIVSWMLTGAAGYDGEDQGLYYTFFRKFHNEWTTKSDLVVEASSQKMTLDGTTFDPKNNAVVGYFQEPQEYLLQQKFGTGSSKEVAHVAINQVNDMALPGGDGMIGITQSSHHFEVRRPGAPRMGPDIYAALYDDAFVTQGIQPVAPHAQPVPIPTLVNTTLTGRLAGDLGVAIQDVSASGDFSVRPWSQDPLLQGVGVRTSATGSLQAAVFYDRRQGAFLWVGASAGHEARSVALGNGETPPILTLTRTGALLTATATYQGGVSRTGSLSVFLPAQVRVGVLSSAEGRTAAVTPPALLGTLQATPDASVDPYQEWALATYVREMGGEANQSRPRLVLHNADTRSLQGVYLEYWFTADPARSPVVEFDRAAGVSWTVEHFGGEQYVLKIASPEAVVAPGAIFPDAEGLAFRIHNQDWSPRWNRGDWSRDHNIGVAQKTSHVVVRASDGRILAGELPPVGDPSRTTRVRVLARDAGAHEGNIVKPEIRLRNLGPEPLRNYRIRWVVQLPEGAIPQVEDWSQVATLSQRSLGHGLWEIEALYDRYVLFPQQDAPELKIGIHRPDWSAWDKSLSPSKVGGDWIEHRGVVVLDGEGRRIWGDLPEFQLVVAGVPDPPTHSADLSVLAVSAREESPGDAIYARPRVRVANTGAQEVKGFQLGLWFDNPGGAVPVLDASWYAPGCAVSQSTVSSGQKLTYSCPDVSIASGAVWPDVSGSVVGLHLPLWQGWTRDASWSLAGLTGSFAPTDLITVETLSGVVVKGAAP